MKARAQVGNLPAGDQAGALAQRGAHLAVDVVQALAVDQRAHFHVRLGDRVAIAGGGHGCADAFDKLVGNLALHVHPLGAVAHLAGVDDARIADGFDRQLQVGICQYDGRCLAAQFQVELGDIRCRR